MVSLLMLEMRCASQNDSSRSNIGPELTRRGAKQQLSNVILMRVCLEQQWMMGVEVACETSRCSTPPPLIGLHKTSQGDGQAKQILGLAELVNKTRTLQLLTANLPPMPFAVND